ncbi:MAG: ParB/RepB/Spo0J family partition protein [Faecalibacterium prausnitzii]
MPIDSGNLALKGLDDLFSTEENRQEEQQEQVRQIPIDDLHPFTNHPFKVLDDEAMTQTVESIKLLGVTNPLIVRPRPEGGYEIISGHRRQHAAQLAGLDTLPVIVRQMDDDAAVLLMDEMHLLLKEEQTAAYSVEIWKRFRKWGGIPTGLTQNVKDLLSSREVENIFENSDMIIMLNQAAGDRQILAKQLNISPHQLSYVTHSGEGEGLLFFGNVILPFVDRFPTDLELYRIMTTKLGEVSEGKKE